MNRRAKRKPLPAGSTTARGYGAAHAKARTLALAAFRNGDRCHLCGRPMFSSQKLDLDHTPDRRGIRGLAHASCNRRDGAVRGNALRKTDRVAVPIRYSRVW